MFQLFTVGRCGQHAKPCAAGLESMRGLGEGAVPSLYGTHFLHENPGVVQIGCEDLARISGRPGR